jgi:hypothetical protein
MKQHRLKMQLRKFQKQKARQERNRMARHEAGLPPVRWVLQVLVGEEWKHRLHLHTPRAAAEAQGRVGDNFVEDGVKAVRIVEHKTGNVVWSRERPVIHAPPPPPAEGVQSHTTPEPGVEAPV